MDEVRLEKQLLNYDQAVALLNEGDTIHVFVNPNGMLVGADWSRKEVLKLLKEADEIQIGGEQCIAFKHGLVATSGARNHFIESKAGL
jgi:hypothetical protein